MPKRIALVVLALSFFSSPVRADWEANVTATNSKGEFQKVSGKFFSKIDRFRLDTAVPFDMSVFVKGGATQALAAVHSFRIRLNSKLNKFEAQVPSCLAESFNDCVKRFGMKKTKEVKCGEGETPRTCEIFVGSSGMPGVKQLEVWHWKGEREPILAKAIATKLNGAVIEVKFLKISRKAHDALFYAVPAHYKDAGSLEKFMGDFKGQ